MAVISRTPVVLNWSDSKTKVNDALLVISPSPVYATGGDEVSPKTKHTADNWARQAAAVFLCFTDLNAHLGQLISHECLCVCLPVYLLHLLLTVVHLLTHSTHFH